jgi:hypothetical protein
MLSAFEVDNGVFKVIYVNAIDEELINEKKGVCQIPKLLLQRIMVVQFIQIQYHYFNPIKSAETNAAEALARRNSTV